MAISLTHDFVSAKTDGADASYVQPSNWNAQHTLTLGTAKLVGRSSSGVGFAEEIGVDSSLSISAQVLAVIGAAGSFTLSGSNTPTALTGNVDDYNPSNMSTTVTLRLDGGASDRNITGLAGGGDGRIMRIINIGSSNNLVLKNEDTSSLAQNRFLLGGDLTIPAGQPLTLQYDNASSRWRALSTVTAGALLSTGGTMSGALNYAQMVTLASAGTVNIGAAAGNYIYITGITTITAFDTIASGAMRILRFEGALTLTHNVTSLIIPGAANVTTAAGDCAIVMSEGSGNWRVINYIRAAALPLLDNAIGVTVQAYDADLTTWAGLTPSANAQSLVTAANYAAMRTLLDLEAGTDFYSIAAADAAFQPIDADLTSWAGVTRAAGFDTFAATPSSANLASLVTGETGSGALVFATSPGFTTAANPVSDGTAALGTTALGWSNLHLSTGGTINVANGNWVLTHSPGIGTVSTGDLRVTTAGTDTASVVTVGGTQTLTSKTLTAPRIASAGFIADANGNEQLIFTTTASAVNELKITNAATGDNPRIDASGETNVGLVLSGKGTRGVIHDNAVSDKLVTLTDGATPALDASLGNVFYLSAAGNRTIAVPTNPSSGQKIIIRHLASGGARTLALNTGANGFRFGTDVTALTATASGAMDYIGCVWNEVDSFWDVVAYSKGY